MRLRQAIHRLIEVGGKRLRPFMVLLAYDAYAPQSTIESVLPAAAAQELLHLAMLIHDDIIDRDLIRYGIANVAGSYRKFYSAFTQDELEIEHFSTSAALLAGDALIADAHALLRRSGQPRPLIDQAADIMTRSIFDVIGGELLDTETGLLPDHSFDPMVIAEFKTSSYSFIGPLTTGAVLANAPEADIQLLQQFGRHLGIAYQLYDDLLGVFGDEAKTGKSTTTDLREGKRTFMIDAFDQHASTQQKDEFYRYFHSTEASESELQRAKEILVEAGADTYTRQRIQTHRAHCENILTALSLDNTKRHHFTALMNICLDRES